MGNKLYSLSNGNYQTIKSKFFIVLVLTMVLLCSIKVVSAQSGVYIQLDPNDPNHTSSLQVTTNEVILTICSPNNGTWVIKGILWRYESNGYPYRTWYYKIGVDGTILSQKTKTEFENNWTVISSASVETFTRQGTPCVKIRNMDGAGSTFDNTTYYTNFWYHPTADILDDGYETPCWSITSGRYLCDSDSR